MISNINNKIGDGDNADEDLKSEFIEDNIICLCKIIETLTRSLKHTLKKAGLFKRKSLPKKINIFIDGYY